MKIYFSLLNYHCAEELQQLIRLLQTYRPSNCDLVFLVTDNSGEFSIERDTSDAMAGAQPYLKIKSPGVNLGFGNGHNNNCADIIFTDEDMLVICNSDIAVDDFPSLVDLVISTPDDRIWSPIINCKSGVWYAGGEISSNTGNLRIESIVPEASKSTGFVTGCMMVMKGNVFHKLSGFNVDYFMYVDDLDLSFRASKAGYELVVMPISIFHRIGSGGRGVHKYSNVYLYENTKNRIDFSTKYFGLTGFVFSIVKYGPFRLIQLALCRQFSGIPIVVRSLKDAVTLCLKRYL